MCMHACVHMFGWVCVLWVKMMFVFHNCEQLIVHLCVLLFTAYKCVCSGVKQWCVCTSVVTRVTRVYPILSHALWLSADRGCVCLCSTLPWSLAQCSECQELVGGPQCVHWRRLLDECTPSVEICNFVVFFPRRRASFDSLLSGWTR